MMEMENEMTGSRADNGSATFVVEIRRQQNASWQGTLYWTGQKKSKHFRSALEMLRLMNEALGNEDPDCQWDPEGEESVN